MANEVATASNKVIPCNIFKAADNKIRRIDFNKDKNVSDNGASTDSNRKITCLIFLDIGRCAEMNLCENCF